MRCAVNPGFGGQAALRWGLGIGLALLTALVLFGGIKRIGAVTENSFVYERGIILMTLIVIVGNLGGVGRAFKAIFSAAFAPRAILGGGGHHDPSGGRLGIAPERLLQRGRSRLRADRARRRALRRLPVEQGIYGIFEVFMDTIVICTLTALTIIISGVDVTFGVKARQRAHHGGVRHGVQRHVLLGVHRRGAHALCVFNDPRLVALRLTLRAVPAGAPRREGLPVRFHYHDRRRQRLLA